MGLRVTYYLLGDIFGKVEKIDESGHNEKTLVSVLA